MCSIVVIFDFDRTIIDGDSDNWIVTEMGLTQLFQRLVTTIPWNSLMNKMMEELHEQGKTIEDIAECLKRMEIDPHIISAIKSTRSMGCELRIVSDANQFFIETILKRHQLLECFTEIVTNPTVVENGRLKIAPYHDSRLSPHSCAHCPSNMCKGMILEHIQESVDHHGKSTFIYLGDGGGDYCPSLRLRSHDYVMPRKGFPLWDRIQRNASLVHAKIHEWSTGEELERTLIHLVSTVTIDGNN